MSIEVPEWVQWLLPICVGAHRPEGDEDALRRMAEAYRVAAVRIAFRFLSNILIEIGTSVAIDVVVQLTQCAMGTRENRDGSKTLDAVQSGAVGGAFDIPGAKVAAGRLGGVAGDAASGVAESAPSSRDSVSTADTGSRLSGDAAVPSTVGDSAGGGAGGGSAGDGSAPGGSARPPGIPEFLDPGGPRYSGIQRRRDPFGRPIPGHVRDGGKRVPHGFYDRFGAWMPHGVVDQYGRWIPGHRDVRGQFLPNGYYDQQGRWLPHGRLDDAGRWVPMRFDGVAFHDTGVYHPRTGAPSTTAGVSTWAAASLGRRTASANGIAGILRKLCRASVATCDRSGVRAADYRGGWLGGGIGIKFSAGNLGQK
ncbi:hypothetical protein [Haloactinomyces albus]|uniref:Uncharacterized protein n=1 Tax=Haloactinomyces albus TaxID=1352928 RepID=A0AAE3ZG96_9ACTN|nr:hypothetical protein [Haloactinomyces albus]MDR7302459.1 hypothetical protein [Haloactinomyces albus]